MRKMIGEAIFKLNGWTYEYDKSFFGKKQVVIGFEHTSNLDTILSLALFEMLGIKINTLIKKELFKGPLKPILKALGGIAVDRQASKDIVSLMAEEFAKRDEFTLVIAPEATRAKGQDRKPIRTGFWHIAKAANVPIVMMFANSKTKHGGVLGKIILSDDMQADLEKIKALYQGIGIDVMIPSAKINA
jgi:1-acyl-sn-glycerol-3-phosphate acyltransferase